MLFHLLIYLPRYLDPNGIFRFSSQAATCYYGILLLLVFSLPLTRKKLHYTFNCLSQVSSLFIFLA